MEGVRILDLSRVLAGPWAAQHLADQGAEVWKVESPEGDETRQFGPVVDGTSTYFVSCNRNKQSIVLDLRTEAGREVARRLASEADVVLHNWRPGVAERLGLDYGALRTEHPGLVYVCLSAFGSDGAADWTTRAGYDLVLQAMGGAMSFTGTPGQPPVRAGTPIADLVAGLLVTQAVLYGLLHRERTGSGQRIEVNMMQAQAACLVYHLSRYTITGEAEVQRGNTHRGLVPYDVYPCADGWLAVACGNDGLWQKLRSALGIEDRAAWRTNLGRVGARAEVDEAVAGALRALSVADADRRLAVAGVPVGPVQDTAQVVLHPSVDLAAVPHPVLGELALAGPILKTATTRTTHRPPPELGADRDAILASAGYDPDRIRDLAARRAFGGGEQVAVRVRKLARELDRSPEDVLLLLKDLGYERFRSSDDMISEVVADQLRKLARKTPPRAVLPKRPVPQQVTTQRSGDDTDFMAQVVPGVVRKFVRPASAMQELAPAGASAATSSATAAPVTSGRATSGKAPVEPLVDPEWEALETERAGIEAEREALEAERTALASAREAFEAERAAFLAEREGDGAQQAAGPQGDLGPSLLALLEERGLRGVDEAERAMASLAAGHALGRHLANLLSTDPKGLRRVLSERLVLFGGAVPEGVTVPAVTVSEDRADLPGAERLHRTLDRLGETLMLNGYRRVMVVGVPPRWHTVLRDGVDPRVDLTFRASAPRDAFDDVSRVDLVVGWNVDLEPGKARRLDVRAASVGDLLERWVAALAT